jgi:fluoride exporter
MHWLLVAIGGALGAMARFGLTDVVQRLLPHRFPYGTLVVNLTGCLIFGVIAAMSEFRAPLSIETRTFLLVGVLGGFTTFSSFGYETFLLLRDGHGALAVLNVSGQVLIGTAAVWAGWTLARAIA